MTFVPRSWKNDANSTPTAPAPTMMMLAGGGVPAEDVVRGEDADAVRHEAREALHAAPGREDHVGRDEHALAAGTGRPVLARERDPHRRRPVEPPPPLDPLHAVLLHEAPEAGPHPLDDRVAPGRDDRVVDAHAAVDRHAEVGGLLHPGVEVGRLEERLRRDAAAVEARAADLVLVDERDAHARAARHGTRRRSRRSRRRARRRRSGRRWHRSSGGPSERTAGGRSSDAGGSGPMVPRRDRAGGGRRAASRPAPYTWDVMARRPGSRRHLVTMHIPSAMRHSSRSARRVAAPAAPSSRSPRSCSSRRSRSRSLRRGSRGRSRTRRGRSRATTGRGSPPRPTRSSARRTSSSSRCSSTRRRRSRWQDFANQTAVLNGLGASDALVASRSPTGRITCG